MTSLHKMSRVNPETMKTADLDLIRSKRVVFIVDEAHRTTFGDMLASVKHTLPNALFFGFTGTPIHDETRRSIPPRPHCSAMSYTATQLPTASAIKRVELRP